VVKVIVWSFVVLLQAGGLEKSSRGKVCSACVDWPDVQFVVQPHRIRVYILSC
jgi:hypothetical protein